MSGRRAGWCVGLGLWRHEMRRQWLIRIVAGQVVLRRVRVVGLKLRRISRELLLLELKLSLQLLAELHLNLELELQLRDLLLALKVLRLLLLTLQLHIGERRHELLRMLHACGELNGGRRGREGR